MFEENNRNAKLPDKVEQDSEVYKLMGFKQFIANDFRVRHRHRLRRLCQGSENQIRSRHGKSAGDIKVLLFMPGLTLEATTFRNSENW